MHSVPNERSLRKWVDLVALRGVFLHIGGVRASTRRPIEHVEISNARVAVEQEAGLPRYFFHLVLDDRIIADEDGSEMDGLAEARSEADAIIRELAGEHVRTGRAFHVRSVRIVTGDGAVLDEVSSDRILREIFFHHPA